MGQANINWYWYGRIGIEIDQDNRDTYGKSKWKGMGEIFSIIKKTNKMGIK